MAPAPNRFHQGISSNIEFILAKYLETHPVGMVYHAPFDVFLTDINVFQPDIVFITKNNYKVLTDIGVEGTPDFGAKLDTEYIMGMAKVKGVVKTLLDIDRIVGADTMQTLDSMR